MLAKHATTEQYEEAYKMFEFPFPNKISQEFQTSLIYKG